MQPYRSQSDDPQVAQRAIVLQLLSTDRRERWSLKQLEHMLCGTSATAINDAVVRLGGSGVIVCLDEFIRASRCAQHLDSLGLIAV